MLKGLNKRYPMAYSDDRLAVLLSELEQCREDDRGANNLLLQVIGAGVAALAIVFALAASDEGIAAQSPEWVFPVFAVGIIIAVFSYATSVGIKMSLRYHYMRYLEKEIRTLAEMGEGHYGWNEVASPIITLNVHHIRSGWTVKHFASLVGAVLAALAVCVMLGVYFFLDKNPAYGALAVVLVSPFLVLFLSNFGGTSSSEAMYGRALEIADRKRFEARQRSETPNGSRKVEEVEGDDGGSAVSKLVAYLVYPRPKDALKILFILFGTFLGVALSDASLNNPTTWLSAAGFFLVSFLVFDFLGYQARYQWNDVRGYAEDEHNPEAKKRARLPHVEEDERLAPRLSLAVACYRVLLALAICWCNPLGAGSQLFGCLVATFAIAGLYEFARSKRACPALLLLVLVSLGYPLRIFVGMWVACPSLFQPAFFASNALEIVSVSIASVLFGMVFVGLTWALEGCDHHLKNGRPAYHKRHVDRLALKLPGAFSDPYPLRDVRPVFAVWNVAMFLSMVAMFVPIAAFAPYGWLSMLACLVFAVLFLCMVLLPAPVPSFLYIGACVLLIAGALACLFAWFPQGDLASRESSLWCLTVIGLSVYLAIYTGFRNTNYEEMNDSLDSMKQMLVSGAMAFLAALVGKETADLLAPSVKGKK